MKIHFIRLGVLLCMIATALHTSAQNNEESNEDYKTACQTAINNIEQISSSSAISTAVSAARLALRWTSNKSIISTAMTTLRGAAIAYLQADNNVTDSMNLTGLVGNHSFDTGGMSKWYGLSVDESSVNVGSITSAIMSGDLSGLANAISINTWKESTVVTPNSDATAMADSDLKYHLRSEQMIMQPLIGLPAGIYEMSVKGSCAPGFLKMNKVHLSAIVVPAEVVQEILGDATSDISNLQNLIRNFDLAQYISTFLQHGKLKTNATTPSNIDTFADCKLRFMLGKGDIVIIGINAGITPFIGANAYRADNVRLNLIRSSHGILEPAREKLNEAIKGRSQVMANYDRTDTLEVQPAFNFERSLTKAYNQALITAIDKYYNSDITDIEKLIDLNNTDNINSSIANIYDKDIETLNQAYKAFREGAFIVPEPEAEYNISLRGDLTQSYRWFGNAITLTEDAGGNTAMAFSTKPGEGNYAQAIRFEPAPDADRNTLLARIPTGRGSFYLARTEEGLCLSAEKEKALPLTVDLSYNIDGGLELIAPDSLVLWVNGNDDTLVLRERPSASLVLRQPDLHIEPAAETRVTASIPASGIATVILPFDAELPEGMEAFSATGIGGETGITLQLNPENRLLACKPYIIRGAEGKYTFSGMTYNTVQEHSEGLLTGTFSDLLTTGDEYVMTELYGTTVFSLTPTGNTMTIPSNQCFIRLSESKDTPYVLLKDEDADGILQTPFVTKNNTQSTYDLMGRLLPSPTRGIIVRQGKKYINP